MQKYYYNEPSESYDAIVVGSGISGGWAAKELCEKGLKTLVLERGPMIEHIKDYHTAHMDPWDFPYGDEVSAEVKKRQHKQLRFSWNIKAPHHHFFVDDIDHPYNEPEGYRFDWIHGYIVGGRSIMWGKQSYRWSDFNFEANKREGIAIDWPVRYKDLAPWYDHVEEYIGVSGENRGFDDMLPDGKFEPPMELNIVEKKLQEVVESQFENRYVTPGRVAHITSDKPFEGRTKCQYRNRCTRGCPFGAYFSTQASTLPAAVKTGNLTLRVDAIVSEVVYDEKTGKASGVKFIDKDSKEEEFIPAKVVFLNASAIASAAILMNSKSDRFPNGLGNDSGELGRNIMDHHLGSGAGGRIEGYTDKYYKGRRPNGFYIPRYRNLNGEQRPYKRGFGYQGGASRGNWQKLVAELAYGKELKDAILKPGEWNIGMTGFGEILPDPNNRMELDYDRLDQWGLPTITFYTKFSDNEYQMREDIKNDAVAMLEAMGAKDIYTYDGESQHGIGLGIHEMGTARMGHDPKTSVTNKYNQIHACKNVFMTDGAFMTSANCVNPSLTYMAFSARAANYAAEQVQKGLL